MEQNPLVSVIMPTWNRAAYLRDSIRCVLDQTHKNLELIIIDDGSTDDTEAVVRSIASPLIKYHKFPNSGRPSIARNRGIALAFGDWIAFCDSDDYWLTDKLERQLAAVGQTDSRWICSNALLDQRNEPYFADSKSERLQMKDLIRKNQVICSSILIQRSLLTVAGGFDETAQMNEDYLLWLRLALEAPLFYLADCLLRYTTNSTGSVSRSKTRGRSYEVHTVLFMTAGCALRLGDLRAALRAAAYGLRMGIRFFLEDQVKPRWRSL